MFDPGVVLQELDRFGVDRLVDGRGALAHPGPPFQSVAGVDHSAVHLGVAVAVLHLVVAVGVPFHRHKDERRQLGTPVDHLEGRAGVAAPDPRILDERQLLEIDPEPFEEPLTELDTVVLPVHLTLVGVVGAVVGVERVVAHHLEGHRVTTGLADVVDVLHPDTRLAHRERVPRRWGGPAGDVGLEVVDRRLCQQHVLAPPVGRDRVRLDPFVVVRLEVVEKLLAHLAEAVRPVESGVVDEGVLLAGWFPTQLPVGVAGPEVGPTGGTLPPVEPLRREVVQLVCLGEVAHSSVVGPALCKRVPGTPHLPSGDTTTRHGSPVGERPLGHTV